jgi:8-oxo-dGTP diphosphatase
MAGSRKATKALPRVQLAAGGIIWTKITGAPKLAVIHRPKYGDWTLPKGKPEKDETLAQTARREVREELGCDADFRDFAGTTHYDLPDGRLKVVLFWNMALADKLDFHPNNEVDQMLWLTPPEAIQRLDHPAEKELVAKVTCNPPKS